MKKNTIFILSMTVAFLCTSPKLTAGAAAETAPIDMASESQESTEFVSISDNQERAAIESRENTALPSVTQKTITWTGGLLKIPVDLGGYGAEDLRIQLTLNDGSETYSFYGLSFHEDENVAALSPLDGFDSHGLYTYKIFINARSFDGKLEFIANEGNSVVNTDTIIIRIPNDNELWNVPRKTVKFDGNQDIVFNFKNGTNGYALQSIKQLALFINKGVGNLFLPDKGFSFDMNAGKVTIASEAVNKTLTEFAKSLENGISSLPDKIWVNTFAVTEGGEEVRFNVIETGSEDIFSSKDVAWTIDLTEFKASQISKTPSPSPSPYTEPVNAVNAPANGGSVVKVDTDKIGTAAVAAVKNTKNVTVPTKVKVGKVKYTVTAVKAKAFAKAKKAAKITIQKPFKKLTFKKNAFKGSSKTLKTVVIKITKASQIKAEKGSFKALRKSTVVKVGKKTSAAQLKKIQKALKNAGFKGVIKK